MTRSIRRAGVVVVGPILGSVARQHGALDEWPVDGECVLVLVGFVSRSESLWSSAAHETGSRTAHGDSCDAASQGPIYGVMQPDRSDMTRIDGSPSLSDIVTNRLIGSIEVLVPPSPRYSYDHAIVLRKSDECSDLELEQSQSTVP